jgi:hypothetical protein
VISYGGSNARSNATTTTANTTHGPWVQGGGSNLGGSNLGGSHLLNGGEFGGNFGGNFTGNRPLFTANVGSGKVLNANALHRNVEGIGGVGGGSGSKQGPGPARQIGLHKRNAEQQLN